MLSLDLIWWLVLARLAHPSVARWLVHLFMAAQLIALIWLIAGRMSGLGYDRFLPKFVMANVFIWHFIGLGILTLVGIGLIPILLVSKLLPGHKHGSQIAAPVEGSWTRRDFLRFGAAIAPPLLTLGASAVA